MKNASRQRSATTGDRRLVTDGRGPLAFVSGHALERAARRASVPSVTFFVYIPAAPQGHGRLGEPLCRYRCSGEQEYSLIFTGETCQSCPPLDWWPAPGGCRIRLRHDASLRPVMADAPKDRYAQTKVSTRSGWGNGQVTEIPVSRELRDEA